MPRIVIDLDYLPEDVDAHKLTILLRDALADFRRLRTPADKYVHERYAGNEHLDMPEKIAEVEGRVALAGVLRNMNVAVERYTPLSDVETFDCSECKIPLFKRKDGELHHGWPYDDVDDIDTDADANHAPDPIER